MSDYNVFDKYIEICLKKAGSYIDFPFGPSCLVIKVKAPNSNVARVFAQFFMLKDKPKATFNCTAEDGFYFKSAFPDSVSRGYHCPQVQQPYFYTVALDGSLDDSTLKMMIDNSYTTVVSKLPKYIQTEIKGIDGGSNSE